MSCCRICGAPTAWRRPLCPECDRHLGRYESTRSRGADTVIPVRRYGSVPPPAPTVLPTGSPPATPEALLPWRPVLLLVAALLAGALWLAWRLA